MKLLVSTAKGRTNFDLRDTLSPEDAGSRDSMQSFTPRRASSGRVSPFTTAGSGKRRQNDTGYSSSTSSGTPPTLSIFTPRNEATGDRKSGRQV